ncbi:MAG TPA: tlde1 domain-containing protein [Rhodoblastus sp.]|nr:tlde1 domain-containing protein [Rhodoblastus sp.]
MTDWSIEISDRALEPRPSLSRKIFVRTVPALAAFSFSAAVALRLAGGLANQAHAPQDAAFPSQPALLTADAATSHVAVPHVELASGPAKPDLGKPRNPFGGLFDPEGEIRGMPAMQEARTDPLGPSFSPLQAQPLFTLVDAPEEQTQETSQVAEAEPAPQVAEASAPDLDNTPLKPALPALQTAQTEAPDSADDASAQAENAPLPPARPAQLASLVRAAEETPRHEAVTPPPAPISPAAPTRAAAAARETGQTTTLSRNDPRSFFDNIFNKDTPNAKQERKGPQLAYAAPDGGGGLFNLSHIFPSSPAPVQARGGTAVYDISAHTVYLPSGARLEAHSGLGPYFDNPSSVHIRMRGATPPATYRLSLRESLFHGVQAIRLTPLDSNVHGRNGLLAHTFMLGPRGESNGCVSFRNYRAFLDAYMRGEIKELRVVASR